MISRDFSFYLHTGESLDSPSLASGLATPSATLKAINELVVETAVKLGVEDGSKLRSPGRVHRLGDAAMAAVVEIRGGGGPGRGKKGGAEAHLLLPKDDPGKDTAIRWRKLCDKVKVEGKTKRETGRGKGEKSPALARVTLPEDDPGQDVADRWRKLCDKVKVEGKTKRETGRGKKHSQQ